MVRIGRAPDDERTSAHPGYVGDISDMGVTTATLPNQRILSQRSERAGPGSQSNVYFEQLLDL